jgi:DNA-binding NarL/FixJ family response regulator
MRKLYKANDDRTKLVFSPVALWGPLSQRKSIRWPSTVMISVAIVEDDLETRRNLELLIGEAPGFRCVCVCASGEEALSLVPQAKPEVVLMDLHLSELSGIECTAKLKQLVPALQVIIISMYSDTDKVFKALRAGAAGYLLKPSTPEEILDSIREVQRGGAPMTSEIARKVVEAFKEAPAFNDPEDALTRREQEILELLCRGFSNKDIADTLSISFETVRWHNLHIYQKLRVRSRSEAAAKLRGGLDSPAQTAQVTHVQKKPKQSPFAQSQHA